MTVHHYFKKGRSVNPEYFKDFESFFKCSRKNSYDETGSQEDRHRKGSPRVSSAAQVSSLEIIAREIAAQINASEFK